MIRTYPIRLAWLTFAFSCLAALLLPPPANAQSSSIEFPYQALVAKDNALVRSGPGQVHYGTQELPAGQVVEVYRHDPDGWCAIRPVEGSFSIIPASTVEITSEGVGEIKMSGTTPFVGTKLGTVEKPLWQVKLREKEKVSLIGQLSWPNPEGHSTIWYQIKPPAGEFRWINISNLESLSGETMASVIQPKPTKRGTPSRPNQLNADSSTEKFASTATPTAELAHQSNVTPVKPGFDFATTQREHARTARAIPSTPAQPRDRSTESNDFAVNPSDVQLASYGAPPAAPTPTPPKPAVPPLQDSGSGWRRATRAIPSDNDSKSSKAGFTQYEMPSDNRSQFDSSSNYNNSSFTGQHQQNYNPTGSPPNQPNHSNFDNQAQSSFAGQIRVADANPQRNRFAQQLDRSRGVAQTFTGQPATQNPIQTLNNQLTIEMLKAPSAWQLDPLEAATRQFMGTTGSFADQQAGTQFLTKLENCRRVAAGYGNAGNTSNGSGFTNPGSVPNANGFLNGQSGYGPNNAQSSYVGTNSNVDLNTFGTAAPRNSQFDATGWLNELKHSRGTSPSTYVLQDASGKIIYQVSPVPGINLSRYLKKRVGVSGQLGFNQKLNLRHVTIERVFPL